MVQTPYPAYDTAGQPSNGLVMAYQQPAVVSPYSNLGLTSPSLDGFKQRLILSIAGFEKTGKTHLACTGRGPVVVINLDVGDEGVVEKFAATGKEVYVHNIPLQRPTVLISASDGASQEIWKKQWIDLNIMLEHIYSLQPGTVVIDTMTEVYELARLAHFGKTDQVMPNKYGVVYAELRSLVRQAYAAENTTTVFVHKMGMGFDSKQPETKGWKEMDFMTQVNLRNDRTPPETGYGMDTYFTVVKDCRQNPNVNGYRLDGEQFSIPYIEWFVLQWRP